jgi:hypothetical protein
MNSFQLTFSGLNFLAIVAAFGFCFVSGAIWFSPKTFYPIWMKERGIASGQLNAQQNKPALLFGGTILGLLIQIFVLALIINSLAGQGEATALQGATVGLALGVGISMFSSLSHRLFGGESLKVWLIETASDGVNLTVAGAIIAILG